MEYPPCRKCGANHSMGVEDMQTGNITPLDLCSECLWDPINIQAMLHCPIDVKFVEGYQEENK